jgi:Zn-dependent protease with chaperone function
VWRVADGMGLQSRWIGYVLVLDRELVHHQYLAPILAHELGHANSEDRLAHRLYAMLPRVKAIACLFGGLAFGIGHVLLFPLWAWYWRSRIYAADSFAVQCGQGHALVKALNGLYLKLDTTTRYGRMFRPVPYVEQRIDHLKHLLEP